MSRFGFCGGFYTSQSVNADCQTAMNWYPESDESGLGNSQVVLYHTPGTKLYAGLPKGPVRGMYAGTYVDRAFVVAGSGFYELLPNDPVGYKLWGNLNNEQSDGSAVQMVANNANQLLICSMGVLYVFNFGTGMLVAPKADIGPYSRVFFLDGYFMATIARSQKFQLSALEDGLTWNDLDVAQVLLFTDNIVGGVVDHEEFWLFGRTQSVPYYDSGDNNFPFAPNKTGIIQQGAASADSIVQLDNTVMWIGQNNQGGGIAWRLNGYTPSRVSTHAIETAWQSYSTINDAIAYAYQDQGHSFWVIYFPSADKTWVYDIATGLWHERGKWEPNQLKYTAHRSRCYMYFQGKHLVGDWKTGNVYQMSINFYDDDGDVIRRLRRAPHLSVEQQWTYYDKLQVYVEPGLGPGVTGEPEGTQSIILAGSLGLQWRITVTDDGLLTATEVDFLSPEYFFLTSPAKVWLVGFDDALGNINITQVPSYLGIPTQPYIQFLSTPGRIPWQLRVEVGENRIQTIQQGTYKKHGPLMSLRYSNDGGHTWSNERLLDCGALGEFRKRVIARRLGRARDRVFEISCTDSIPWRIIDAYVDAGPQNYQAQDRLNKELQKRA